MTSFAIMTLPDGLTINLSFLKNAAGNGYLDIRRLQPESGIYICDSGLISSTKLPIRHHFH